MNYIDVEKSGTADSLTWPPLDCYALCPELGFEDIHTFTNKLLRRHDSRQE